MMGRSPTQDTFLLFPSMPDMESFDARRLIKSDLYGWQCMVHPLSKIRCKTLLVGQLVDLRPSKALIVPYLRLRSVCLLRKHRPCWEVDGFGSGDVGGVD